MFPTDFDQSNQVFDKPEGVSRDECEPLNVWAGTTEDKVPLIISCWKPTQEEMEEFQKTGRLWIYHWGHALQPHSASMINPFE